MKSFRVPPFNVRVYVTSEPEEFVKRHNLYASSDDAMDEGELTGCLGMAAHQVRAKAPHALFLLYLPPDCTAGTLFHEALHLTHFLMEYHGMPIDMESTELQAYTMEYVAAQAARKL